MRIDLNVFLNDQLPEPFPDSGKEDNSGTIRVYTNCIAKAVLKFFGYAKEVRVQNRTYTINKRSFGSYILDKNKEVKKRLESKGYDVGSKSNLLKDVVADLFLVRMRPVISALSRKYKMDVFKATILLINNPE